MISMAMYKEGLPISREFDSKSHCDSKFDMTFTVPTIESIKKGKSITCEVKWLLRTLLCEMIAG